MLFTVRGVFRTVDVEATAYLDDGTEVEFTHTCSSSCDVLFAYGDRTFDAAHGVVANGPGAGLDPAASWKAWVTVTERAVSSGYDANLSATPIHEDYAAVYLYSNYADPGLSSAIEASPGALNPIIVYLEPRSG